MKFKLKTTINYDIYAPTTFVFNIQALKTASFQKIISETLEIAPNLPFREYSLKASTARYLILKATEYVPFSISYEATIETKFKLISKNRLLKNTPLFDLKNEIIPFLTPSRHCPSDKLLDFAFNNFGHFPTDLEKALAINDWIYNNIKYVTGSSDANTTAFDTFNQGEGVCKDFAHLGIALCRALTIPARYFTCYANNIYPPDIHACFEVYLGNNWIIFDPTRLASLDQIVKIAHGKDGSEIAVASFFGNVFCTFMNIECSTLNNDSEAFHPSEKFFISY
jgi:transglutaminase-like putative cysteine protease